MVSVRPARPGDYAAISTIVTAAFGRADEAAIVEALRVEGAALVELVAEDAGSIVGHVLFSRMQARPAAFVAALGPLAVTPQRQRHGVGSALARQGIEACGFLGAAAIVVLGHPAYYPRFGFSAEAAATIRSPFAGLPAFMALELQPEALASPIDLAYPAAFG